MSRAFLTSLLALSLCSLTACGDGGSGDGDDGSSQADAGLLAADAALGGPDAAPGAPALLVQGTLTVDNAANDVDGSAKRVFAELVITRDGAPVTNAIVRLNPPGAVQTFLTGKALEPSVYTGNYMGYNNDTVRIEISADDDEIAETVLLGQSMFRISAPEAGAELGARQTIDVAWSTDGAVPDVVVVTTDEGGYESDALAGDGTHEIPGGVIGDGDGTDTIRVRRARRNELAGAAAGSRIDFGVEAAVGVVVSTP